METIFTWASIAFDVIGGLLLWTTAAGFLASRFLRAACGGEVPIPPATRLLFRNRSVGHRSINATADVRSLAAVVAFRNSMHDLTTV